jgi:hypothetical protein
MIMFRKGATLKRQIEIFTDEMTRICFKIIWMREANISSRNVRHFSYYKAKKLKSQKLKEILLNTYY